MAVITVYGKTPDVGSAAFVAPNATLAGDVVLAAGSSVWYGAVVRGDTGAIRIGKNSNIQDNAVLHTGPNLGVTIGKNVSIGHSAVVHGCTVGDGALIGMHATVMNGAVVGKNAVVAAGALVLENADAGAVLATTAVDIINSYFSREDTVSIVPENQLIP